MRVAVCYNRVPPRAARGEAQDWVSEDGARAEAMAVAAALRASGHSVETVILGSGIGDFVDDLVSVRPDVVFNLCEGFWGDSGREMHAAALIELLGFPHTGSGPLCLGLTQDKARTKDLLAAAGLPTPAHFTVPPGGSEPDGVPLDFPLFVKPRREDASLGISAESVVDGPQALSRRIGYVHRVYRQDALVERYVDGRELNVAVIGNGPRTVLPISEIVFAPGLERPVVGYSGKWLTDTPEYHGTVPVCPAPLDPGVANDVREIASRACDLLGCRGYARVDIRLGADRPQILEINANPDISPDAGLARSAAAAGIDYRQLIDRVLDLARSGEEAVDA